MKAETIFKLLLTCNLISSISLSIITPFFPLFAKTRGIPEDVIGFIFSAHPLGASVAAFIIGKIMNNNNQYKIMSSGLLVQGLSMFSFVSLQLVDEQGLTILISTIARFLNGVGSAMFFTPFYATVPQLFPSNVESQVAISAFINSLGFMIGPIFGSILYSIGGFKGPFAFFGVNFLSKQIFEQYFNYGDQSSFIASALFNIAASCGELVGPIASGNLVQQFGFDRTASCLGLALLLVAILTIPLVYKEIFTSSLTETIQIEICVKESEQFKNNDLLC